ncbi:hypothetical protein CTI12_AA576020 [Artemisia annua]|uniref:Zinc knuckle CX2CX4HX4C n=1 Tax=Artemisia annua TaxID=35608 RepID=A0A2U1KQI4_ARTAN|nr:hypothetical protein CTI12_AA576020 [Artemisia annua]
MDRTTTSICDKQYGRASFARVLVEIESSKPLVDSVELWYESLGKVLRLGVEYSWVPPRCEECKTFGHYYSECARKINVARAVNKDGDTVKPIDAKNGINNDGTSNGNNDEGWTTASNRRNRGDGNNVRQANFGGYNARRMVYGNKTGYNNTNNNNRGNMGTKEASKRSEPVNSGNVGEVDDSVVVNDNGQPGNKGKGKVDEGVVGNEGNGTSGNVEARKNIGGTEDSISENNELWNEVKVQVEKACESGVPILESVIKGWSDTMIKFYMEKWNNRVMRSGSLEPQLEFTMKNLANRIIQLNQNLNNNAKLNAEIMMKNSGLTTQDNSDVSFRKFYDATYLIKALVNLL